MADTGRNPAHTAYSIIQHSITAYSIKWHSITCSDATGSDAK